MQRFTFISSRNWFFWVDKKQLLSNFFVKWATFGQLLKMFGATFERYPSNLCKSLLFDRSTDQGTGSRGDVFVVRSSKPVENLWKNGLFWSRYSFVTHSIDCKPACLGRPSGEVPCASEDMACGYWFSKVDLGQIRSEEIVYSRFIKIPLGWLIVLSDRYRHFSRWDLK